MSLHNPGDFYDKYRDDFDKEHGPGLLQLSWNDSPKLWTYLNMSYLTRLAIRSGFTPVGEYKRVDLLWSNNPPSAPRMKKVVYELAVEEEWEPESSNDKDLCKLLEIRAYLKVFSTALKYKDWDSKKHGFQETVKELLKQSDAKYPSEAYLLMNLSPYPEKEPWDGLQIDGGVVDYLGNWTPLQPKRFPSVYTGL